MVLSEQQKEIIEKSKQLIKNQKLKINAFAGTGKTTTLKAITEQISNQRFLYLAFNNDIVKEAEKSFKSNVFTTTINSLAYNKIISKYKLTIQKQKFEPIIIGEILGIDFSDAYDVYNTPRKLNNFL
ncbi:DEAD/DEAH box helicase family protein [Aliarcobacter butzleri]|uniref:DEAD/DEAH box helicase family protein n=1 Tax=Aliarcobacter butzleri TaxID=28197 RepID=UPI0021B331FC|nr:DEAD/DEAH box helicase family protein [Aliarcobacter butzleri]MCT7602473.1 DEAD/DEAH box helicase family protein [Aliarcobacter butzleri]